LSRVLGGFFFYLFPCLAPFLNKNQNELANELNISQATIGCIERDHQDNFIK
jgi:hypothetical protein